MALGRALIGLCCPSWQVDKHHMQLSAAKDKADQLHDQLQHISHEKAQSAQQHQRASKRSAKLAKQVLLSRCS